MKKKILIAEDDVPLRRVFCDALKAEGYDVYEAGDGEEALSVALREHPDLIVLDILMPKMDGIEMARQLRLDAWGKTAKVIILTNLSDIEKIGKAIDS